VGTLTGKQVLLQHGPPGANKKTPARPVCAKPQLIFWPRPWPVIYRNLKS